MNQSDKSRECKILILGSYHSKNFPVLENLKQHLIDHDFENVFIANDIVNIPENGTYNEKMAKILSEIEDLMREFDFNIFIFFDKSNNSTLAEFAVFLREFFKEKKETTLVILPRNYDISMVIGLLTKEKIKIFRYDFDFDIYKYCTRFIIQNSRNIK
ncbi:MAG: hypothetical protein ACFFD2_15720 [Promethearchaeota archaeon]